MTTSAGIEVSDVRIHAEYRVTMFVSGIPNMRVEYSDTAIFCPNLICIRYVWVPESHEWECLSVQFDGPRMKKNGTPGLNNGSRSYLGFTLDNAPMLIQQLVDKYRPAAPAIDHE